LHSISAYRVKIAGTLKMECVGATGTDAPGNDK